MPSTTKHIIFQLRMTINYLVPSIHIFQLSATITNHLIHAFLKTDIKCSLSGQPGKENQGLQGARMQMIMNYKVILFLRICVHPGVMSSCWTSHGYDPSLIFPAIDLYGQAVMIATPKKHPHLRGLEVLSGKHAALLVNSKSEQINNELMVFIMVMNQLTIQDFIVNSKKCV